METKTLLGNYLQRQDLLILEPKLCELLARVLHFTSHCLYFPRENPPQEPVWISREKKLLLPLVHRKCLLGVFMANGVSARAVKKILPQLSSITSICLDALEFYKMSKLDPLTGLALTQEILVHIKQEADTVSSKFTQIPENIGEKSIALHRMCMGLAVIKIDNLSEISRYHSYSLADALVVGLSKALQRHITQDILASRTKDNEFSLLMPSATRKSCQKIIETFLDSISEIVLTNPSTKQVIRPSLSIGYAMYPQDMHGVQLTLDMDEQTRILLQKARLAASVVHKQKQSLSKIVSVKQIIMSYGRILHEGGHILNILEFNSVEISLGSIVGVQEGMHFSVWTSDTNLCELELKSYNYSYLPKYKGEIIIVKVLDKTAIAKVLHLSDIASNLQKDNTIALLASDNLYADAHFNSKKDISKDNINYDPITGLLVHSDFLKIFSLAKERFANFTVAIMRINKGQVQANDQQGIHLQSHNLLESIIAECQKHFSCFSEKILSEATDLAPKANKNEKYLYFGGLYGGNSLIFFHANKSNQDVQPIYEDICSNLFVAGIDSIFGLANYPYLQFGKDDIINCCLKSIDFTMLLPPTERVGTFGSLALNISADKKYSQGDVFGAIEEYKLALLADSSNIMSWNSLGVCMAVLSLYSEARHYFQEALKREATNASTLYNMGVACQNLKSKRTAISYFKKCIKAEPNHYYAHIRLGQMAEQAKQFKYAKTYYLKATKIADEVDIKGSALSLRYLARLAIQQNKTVEARELLHEALIKNPQDAMAMYMLASVYLDNDEDPSMAEMLARKSIAIYPDYKPSWIILSKALQSLDKKEDANSAQSYALSLQ